MNDDLHDQLPGECRESNTTRLFQKARTVSRRIWERDLFAAFISGGASGFSAALSAIAIAPDHFNFGAGMWDTFKMAIAGFLINGSLRFMQKLDKNPLPPA